MKALIRLVSIWEDDDLFEVCINATNGKFSGESNCYSTREEIQHFAKILTGFPKQVPDTIEFSTGPQENNSYFTIELRTIGGLGQVSARVKINETVIYSNAPAKYSIAEFDISPIEASSIIEFSNQLSRLLDSEIGNCEAVLKSV